MPTPPHPLRRAVPARAVVDDFVDTWGEEKLGPFADDLLSGPAPGRHGGDSGAEKEGLWDLWPRLSRIHEGMEALEACRTKVKRSMELLMESTGVGEFYEVHTDILLFSTYLPAGLVHRGGGGLCSLLGGGRSEADFGGVRADFLSIHGTCFFWLFTDGEERSDMCWSRRGGFVAFFSSRCLSSLHLFSQPEHVEMRFAAQCFLLCGVQAKRLLMEAENYEDVGLRGELLEETTDYIGLLMTTFDL